MEVRTCTDQDLDLLRARWSSRDDIAASHFGDQAKGTAAFLVCWDGEEPLGSGMVQWGGCVGENARAAAPGCPEVNHLQVRPEFRNRGVGTAILAAAERLVVATGGRQVAVGVDTDNAGAARLYRRLGYQPTGAIDVITYRYREADGRLRDATETIELLVKHL